MESCGRCFSLKEQRSTGKYCDLKLVVAGHNLWAHACILCPLSTTINTYRDNNHQSKLKKLKPYVKINLTGKVPQDCSECLSKSLDIAYGEKIPIVQDHIPHILSYCDILNFPSSVVEAVKSSEILERDLPPIKTEPLYDITQLCHVDIKENEDSRSSHDLTVNLEDEAPSENKLKFDFVKTRSSDHNSYAKLPIGKKMTCFGCDFKCFRTFDLLNHLRQTGHGGNVCSLCRTVLKSSHELKKHIVLHKHPKPYFCTFCDSRFQTRSLLAQHLPRHMCAKPHTCPHCQKSFKRKHGLNSHLITHSKERKHLCDECGFSTSHARILRAHKLAHAGDFFVCSFPGCTHKSSRKENLKQHFATHSNEKPFICELCGQKFTQSKSLRRHSLIHRKGEFGNLCPHCPFKARRNDNLKAHILRLHTEKMPDLDTDAIRPQLHMNGLKMSTDKLLIKSNDENCMKLTNSFKT